MNEKIATRIKLGLTGEEYYIGTTGSKEKVSIKLNATGQIEWTGHSVTIQNISQQTSNVYQLNSIGECNFEIPMGNIYEITFPSISGYTQPSSQIITASLSSRSVNITYTTTLILNETFQINARVISKTETVSILNNLTCYVLSTTGESYVGTFNSNGVATIVIPYGKTYTLHLPNVGGYYHDNKNVSHISGIQSRRLTVTYTQETLGVCAIHSNGTYYDLDSLEAALTEGTIQASDIVAGSYNDLDLENADRKDGTGNGCGFCWAITNNTTSGPWNSANVNIDTSKIPYVTNNTQGLTQSCGAYNSSLIIEATTGDTTSVATICAERTLTIAGVDRNGFIPAYGQIHRLVLQRSQFQRLYTILTEAGRTISAPTIWSGGWWTSCQNSATYGVDSYNGGFDRSTKYLSYSVFVAFDL